MKRSPRFHFLRRQLPLAIILVLGVSISFLLFYTKQETVRERKRGVFPELAHQHSLRFEWEINAHLDAAETLRDFLAAAPGLNREAFSTFSQGTLERAWAFEAVLWLPLIGKDERTNFESAAAAEGFENFTILTTEESKAPAYDFHCPAYYIEPFDRNRNLSGFDFLADPEKTDLIRNAWKTGRTIASTPLIWNPTNNSSSKEIILLILPVPSKKSSNQPTAVQGFLAAALDLRAISSQNFQNRPLPLDLAVFDVTDRENKIPLYLKEENPDQPAGSSLSTVDFLQTVGERNWLIRFIDERTTRETSGGLESWSLLGGGLLFTGFLTIWFRQRQNYVQSVERRVQNRTAALSRINEDLKKEMLNRHKAEQDLQQSEARFRKAFWHAPTGFGLVSPEGRWTQVNRALMKITGFSEDELLTRTVSDLLHPDETVPELRASKQETSVRPRNYDMELRFRKKNGGFADLLVNIAQVRDTDDRLLYFILQTVDVTRQKLALQETRAAKEFSESIIRSSSDGIFAFDLEKRITVWNSGMEEMTGIPAAEARDKELEEILPFFKETEEEQPLARIFSGGTVRAAERPYELSASGKRGYFAGNYSPLHDGSGGIIGGVAVVRDVTRQREARERLSAFADLLKQRNRELQEFAYVASHDLQEPLRKILAFGDRLERKSAGLLDEQALDYLDRMQNAARRMQILINDLLSFSRISTQASPFKEIDLKKVVQEVLIDLENQIEESSAKIEIGPLPAIEADETQMRQLFQNLISNALKYRKPNSAPHIKIFARTHAAEEDLPPLKGTASLIHVADDGIGFEEKYHDRIFTVFQRLHGKDEYPGTGVGLAICRKIVERHNGWLVARSIPGEGSTFIAGLPHKQFTDS